MIYENLKNQGTLTEVSPPTLVERLTNDDLISPDKVYLTRVNIDRGERGTINTEVFGVVPQNYVGKPVELVHSYHKLPNSELYMQEFYVDGERVINASVVKKT